MYLQNVKYDLYLYHITDIKNLQSIIENGLISRNKLNNKIIFSDIADINILEKRGNLADYVPFHFHPYSSFDYSVRYNNPSKDFIYLCIERSFAKTNTFRILPEHPLSMKNENLLFDYDTGFEKIDWETMAKRNEQIENENKDYAKQVKMAECLSKEPILIDNISFIAVKDDTIKKEVEKILFKNKKILR